MRGWVAAAMMFGALLVSGPAAGSGPIPPISSTPSMLVTSSPHTARAHKVRLTVTLRYEMQCGYPGAGPLSVTFPSAMKPPRRFASAAVKLNKKSIAATVKGRRVTVTIPPPTGVLCDLRGPGSVTLEFTRAAKLTNPAQPGLYRFQAAHKANAFEAKLAIKAAG